ncbi:alpha/beta hydrolase [Pseudoflavitalea sp. X16]|uniref:alpha/beta hydrolase n=1 Tax=Paraflavitalea devenefica TaxID=2716334 RepID=UPI00141E484E|nr:alpha/beta fold hydrolase [Paraflavitalea devenefica]NII23476.1 alpha/beta hydrolase [Paraflavitalea devenefica]
MKKKIIRWVSIIVMIYCIIGIGIFYGQDKILFHPEPLDRNYNYNFHTPYKEVNIPYATGVNMSVVQFTTSDSMPKGVVLYFHGNRQNIGRYAPFAPAFTKQGYEVWMIDYPGYGKSTGPFTEQRLYDWALTFYKLARARFKPDSIVLYGKSMGTGIATQLAAIRDCKHLVLETPYYSFPSITGMYFPIYPVERIIRFKIPTWQYMQQVTAPVTIFHGTDDGVIRYSNAQRLLPYLKPGDQFITIEGGSHNNLSEYPVYQQKLDSLLR